MEPPGKLFWAVVVLLDLIAVTGLVDGAPTKQAPSGTPARAPSESVSAVVAPSPANKKLHPNGAPAEDPSNSVATEGAPGPAAGCDESKAIKGYCMHSPSNCINSCMEEGFAGGACHGIVRRCICSCADDNVA